jgi:hypothetical protein
VDHADVHRECVPAVIELDIKVSFNEVSLGEDTGSSVTRPIPVAPPFRDTIDGASSHEHSFPGSDSIFISDDFVNVVNDESLQPTVSAGQFDVERTVVQKQQVNVNKMSKRSRRDEDTSIILPKKVKKTKRNEIDDIFGL